MESLEKLDYINQVAVECVIFGYEDRQLKVLISKLNYKGDFYVLPSGFIFQDEDLEDAAKRILFERVGIRDIYLEEFSVFGKANRKRKEFLDRLIKLNYLDTEAERINSPAYRWFTNRFISIGYYALLDIQKVTLNLTPLDQSLEWYNINEVPELIMDQNEIFQKALEIIRREAYVKPDIFNLLPEKFTMKEAQHIYETILETQLVRTNFQKKILSMDILQRLEKKFTGAKNRAPYLYRLKV